MTQQNGGLNFSLTICVLTSTQPVTMEIEPCLTCCPDLFQHHLKDVLTAVITRRKAYRLRDGHFPYAFGSDVTPQPYLKNSLAAYHSVTEWYGQL